MTLKEFIKKTLLENNLNHDPDEVEKFIMKEAKKQEKNGAVAISDEDVKKMILEYKPEEQKEIDNDIKGRSLSKSPVEQEKEKKCEEEQKPYQTVLF